MFKDHLAYICHDSSMALVIQKAPWIFIASQVYVELHVELAVRLNINATS